MRIKRIMAFVVDTFIVSLMSSFIVLMPIFNYDTNKQNDILVEYIDKVTSVGSGVLDEEEMFSVMYNYASEGLILNIVSTTLTFIYFGIIGFFMGGNTIGKRLMRIKVVSENEDELNPSLYILREVLLLGIIFKILGIAVTLLIKDISTWYSVYNMISNLSMLVSFMIYGFIIFRDDGRGLHDLIGKTKVVSASENLILQDC